MIYIYDICDRSTGEVKGHLISHEYGLQFEGKYWNELYKLTFYGSEPSALHKKNKGYFWYEKSKISDIFKG